jgi:hypothetical protein
LPRLLIELELDRYVGVAFVRLAPVGGESPSLTVCQLRFLLLSHTLWRQASRVKLEGSFSYSLSFRTTLSNANRTDGKRCRRLLSFRPPGAHLTAFGQRRVYKRHAAWEYSALRYNPGFPGHSFRNIFPALSLASTENVAAPVAR